MMNLEKQKFIIYLWINNTIEQSLEIVQGSSMPLQSKKQKMLVLEGLSNIDFKKLNMQKLLIK